jgi:hypothetical protein
MIEPLFDLGMTDEQLKTVGIISLNWSLVERDVTDILRDFYAFRDEKDATDLVAILDLDKKLNLLEKKMKRDPKPSGYPNADWAKASDFLSCLRKSYEEFREGRNHVIHGTVVRFFGNINDPVIWSHKKRVAKELSELPKILDQSTYLTYLMAHLSSALYGSMLQVPLPDKPGEPPQKHRNRPANRSTRALRHLRRPSRA